MPEAIDYKRFQTDLQLILNNETVHVDEYMFNNPSKEKSTIEIFPSPIILLEGIFMFYKSLSDVAFDKKIFIDCDLEIALTRRLKRDEEERSYNSEEVMYQWKNHFIPSFEEYIFPKKNSCDIVLESNSDFDLNVRRISQQILEEFNLTP